MSESEAPSAPPSAGGSNGMMMAIIVAVIMLAGGFALTYFVLPDQLAKAIVKQMPADDSPGGAAPADKPAGGEAKEGGKEGDKASGAIKEFVLTDLLINVAKTNGTRFVKVTVVFDADPPVLQDLDKNRAKITDIVQQTIGSKTMEELSAQDSRGKLRAEILATVNPLLEAKGEVRNVYFQELIIQ